jgi:hypothetical protein
MALIDKVMRCVEIRNTEAWCDGKRIVHQYYRVRLDDVETEEGGEHWGAQNSLDIVVRGFNPYVVGETYRLTIEHLEQEALSDNQRQSL